MKIKSFCYRSRFALLSFAIPVILVVIGLAANSIYPFGTQQIPVIDMYHQYLPFLSELQHKLQNGESLFYTWDGAGGCNFWNLIAYYGASPLNLLLLFCPARFIAEGVTAILLIKIGLAGTFMCIYLKETNKHCDLGTVAFAMLYALCSFVMGYYWCIMWMDAVLLLPLVILGLQRIINGGRPVLYCITLALTVFCNYYISIMVCIFILFYYPVSYFVNVRNGGKMRCLITTIKAVGYSLLAIAMAAVMLLPTYKSMQSTYYISSEMPDTWSFYNNAIDVLNQLLPFSQLTYREGMPNIYCGLIVVVLVAFYVLDKTISFREKYLNIALLTFLFLSLNINKLDFMWHGFHFPNQLPYRYTFVVSFILIGMAYKAFLRMDQVKTGTIWAVMSGILAWYILAQKFMSEKIDDINIYFYLGSGLLVAYCLILAAYRKGNIRQDSMIVLTTFVILIEMGCNVSVSFNKVGNSDRDYYFENYDQVKTLVEKVDDKYGRVEMNDNFILNTPALYHYKGISQFSSSINADATYLMEQIGIEGEPGKNRYNYNVTNPVTNAILNVRYLIGKNSAIDDSDFRQISSAGESTLNENKYPLALGYVTTNSIWTWNIDLDNPFRVLDDYVRAATDNRYEDVFNEIQADDTQTENLNVTDNGEGAWITETVKEDKESSVQLKYKADKTQKYYVFVEADSCQSIDVSKEDSDYYESIRSDCGSIVNIGEVKKGETFTVTVSYEEGNSGSIVSHVCSLNYDKWDKAYDMISANTMKITDWKDTCVKGSLNLNEGGVLVTSIPYEQGWTLTIDGKECDIDQLVGDEFISTYVTAGEHIIELKFKPPGLMWGTLISLMAILILIIICRFGNKIRTALMRVVARKREALPKREESYREESDCNREGIDSCHE
ncbi:MAG: YfhO family protein [Bacillota bacterium]|nr:YfhO family protein [Bacillota bacterium]